jgi:hypothetical protein
MSQEIIKIIFRYVIWALVAVLIITTGLLPNSTLNIMFYKTVSVIMAYILAEAIWHMSYKIIWGKLEDRFTVEDRSLMAIAIFRGILYAAIIISFCSGI